MTTHRRHWAQWLVCLSVLVIVIPPGAAIAAPSSSAARTLSVALDRTLLEETCAIETEFRLRTADVDGGLDTSGEVALDGFSARLDLEFNTKKGIIPGEARTVDGVTFIDTSGFADVDPEGVAKLGGRFWVRAAPSTSDGGSSALSGIGGPGAHFDALTQLVLLRGAVHVKRSSKSGARFTMRVDAQRAVDKSPSELQPLLVTVIGAFGLLEPFLAEVRLDELGRIASIKLRIDDIPGVRIQTTMRFREYGVAVVTDLPPTEQTIDIAEFAALSSS